MTWSMLACREFRVNNGSGLSPGPETDFALVIRPRCSLPMSGMSFSRQSWLPRHGRHCTDLNVCNKQFCAFMVTGCRLALYQLGARRAALPCFFIPGPARKGEHEDLLPQKPLVITDAAYCSLALTAAFCLNERFEYHLYRPIAPNDLDHRVTNHCPDSNPSISCAYDASTAVGTEEQVFDTHHLISNQAKDGTPSAQTEPATQRHGHCSRSLDESERQLVGKK
eukprot:1161736-Pelagomonas_calceolata.AAC.13